MRDVVLHYGAKNMQSVWLLVTARREKPYKRILKLFKTRALALRHAALVKNDLVYARLFGTHPDFTGFITTTNLLGDRYPMYIEESEMTALYNVYHLHRKGEKP